MKLRIPNSIFVTLAVVSAELILPLPASADSGGDQTSYTEEAISQEETSRYYRVEGTEADLLWNPGGVRNAGPRLASQVI
jgi:hypothetical protein